MRYLLLALLLSGCVSETDKNLSRQRGELRNKLFTDCMELAAKMPRKSDDDVHKVVDACDSRAMYNSNQIIP